MFGHRRRRHSNSSFNQNVASTNPSAASAAAQAFLSSKASSTSLAAAAAGAALRSRPTTPISVADVQTKRTLRRQASNSSAGSAANGSVSGRPNSQLERRGSTSSMTERTFREPSPNRGPLSVPAAVDAPPVPALPKKVPSIPEKSQRRAASVEAPPMRIASPPPNQANGRGSSLGGVPAPKRASQRMASLSSVQELANLERSDSRGSVNFSLPTGARPLSPYGQRKLTSPTPSSVNQGQVSSQKQNMVYDPNTRSFRPEAELLFYEQQILDASRQPPKKKKRAAAQSAEGSHLSQGKMDGRPRGTAVDAMEKARVASPPPRVTSPTPKAQAQKIVPAEAPASVPQTGPGAAAAPQKKKKVIVADPSTESSVASESDSDYAEKPAQFNTRAGALLARQPSIVHEEEEEDLAIKAASRQAALRKLDPSAGRSTSPALPKSNAGRGHGKGQALASASGAEARTATRSASQPPPMSASESTQPAASTNGLSTTPRPRVQSVSPARKAHFSSGVDLLAVKHNPPARSISPRKSALKSSPSPRGLSPAVEGSATNSDVPDMLALNTDVTPVARRKSVRVSFDDDRNTVLGRSAPQLVTESPMLASPQHKKGWFSMGRKKKDSTVPDEDDEKMTPRPALPSFGSVREKKRDVSEERVLVTPNPPTESTPPTRAPASSAKDADINPKIASPASPLFTTATGEPIEYPLSPSHDHGIGAILATDATTKNEANTSRSREPLPPQVTSVEGSGYHSDTSSNYEEGNLPGIGDSQLTTQVRDVPAIDTKYANGHVPAFALTEPTPIAEDKKEWPEMPGGFPTAASISSESSQPETDIPIVGHVPTEPSLVDSGIAEPHPIFQSSPMFEDVPSPIMEETEESGNDMYTDAAEDLSDLEGDGFMSLNAVIDSPLQPPRASALVISTPPESPTSRMMEDRAFKKSQLTRQPTEPKVEEGWDKAQAYWSGLTADKKRELEIAARRDRGELTDSEDETDTETVVTHSPSKVKKTVALPEPVAVPQRNSPERTYQIQPGQKATADNIVPTKRSSMKAGTNNAGEGVHMRRSMREGSTGSTGSMRMSLRGQQNTATMSSNSRGSRPTSQSSNYINADAAEVNAHVRNAAALAPTTVKREISKPSASALKRTGSDASDSSFKRVRPVTEGHSMRGSMRQPLHKPAARPQSPEGPKSSRFSIRSLSPTGSFMRKSFSNPGGNPPSSMGRMTMRDRQQSNDSNTPTLRGATGPAKSSVFGRNKPAQAKVVSSKSTSRFADSDDDDYPAPTHHRSRFLDSDSDDDVNVAPAQPRQRMTTMRAQAPAAKPAALQRLANGVNSDVDDTDDEKPRGKKIAKTSGHEGSALASGSLRRSGSGRETLATKPPVSMATQGQDIPAAPQRPTHKRRGSILSILRRKKADPETKVRKSSAESPARRDTPLERSRPELESVKRQDNEMAVDRPRLQKRGTGSSYTAASKAGEVNGPRGVVNGSGKPSMLRMDSDWPLGKDANGTSLGPMAGQDGRPFTSDGAEGHDSGFENGRPGIGSRRVTATGLEGKGNLNGLDGAKKKKKKFGFMRRAFGLDN